MQQPVEDAGLPTISPHGSPAPAVHEVQNPVAHDRSGDELEAASIKWNVARIVRLSSGRYALLTHYRAGALDLVKVGTIEEIVDFIPTTEQCIEPDAVSKPPRTKLGAESLLAELGL